jgi:hypothetical protein
MKIRGAILTLFLLTNANAQIQEVSDEGTTSMSPHRHEGMEELRKDLPIMSDEVYLREDVDPIPITLIGNDPSNAPGGGGTLVPKDFVPASPPPELPWWERWWNGLVGFFS